MISHLNHINSRRQVAALPDHERSSAAEKFERRNGISKGTGQAVKRLKRTAGNCYYWGNYRKHNVNIQLVWLEFFVIWQGYCVWFFGQPWGITWWTKNEDRFPRAMLDNQKMWHWLNVIDPQSDRLFQIMTTRWGPPVISWFINPINYSYKYHKP
jgi:hypothetical protein